MADYYAGFIYYELIDESTGNAIDSERLRCGPQIPRSGEFVIAGDYRYQVQSVVWFNDRYAEIYVTSVDKT